MPAAVVATLLTAGPGILRGGGAGVLTGPTKTILAHRWGARCSRLCVTPRLQRTYPLLGSSCYS